MSIGTTAGLVAAGIGAAGSIGGAAIGAHAAGSAADKQAQAENNALDFQKQQFATTQANQAPFITGGQTSLQKIIDSINNGTFGPGSIPLPASFTAPTLEQAQQTPGYQFTASEGAKAINRGAAAAGGAFTGGTLKSLAQYRTNLADTTYGDIFNRALSTYGAGLNQYQAALAGQAQGYNQLANVASLGENAAANTGNAGVATGAQVGQTLSNLGGAQASGIIGGANAITGGIGSISNLAQLYGLINTFNLGGGSSGGTVNLNPSSPVFSNTTGADVGASAATIAFPFGGG